MSTMKEALALSFLYPHGHGLLPPLWTAFINYSIFLLLTQLHLAMGKKRKSMASRLDEGDRSMYATFCSAANSLSQLYTLAMNQQKLSFQAGERHALEKLYQWLLKHQGEGSRVSITDIFSHVQTELDYVEDSLTPPRVAQHHHFQSASTNFTNTSNQAPSTLFGQVTSASTIRPGLLDLSKTPVFTNVPSSPVGCGVPPFQPTGLCSFDTGSLQTGNMNPIFNLNPPGENHDVSSTTFQDLAVDMQHDSPVCELY